MTLKLIAVGASAAALLVAGCTTTDPYRSGPVRNNTGTGAIVGAVAGGLLGYLTNTSDSEEGRTNAMIGAGVGALAGAGIGNYMDRQQRQLEQELSGTGVGVDPHPLPAFKDYVRNIAAWLSPSPPISSSSSPVAKMSSGFGINTESPRSNVTSAVLGGSSN